MAQLRVAGVIIAGIVLMATPGAARPKVDDRDAEVHLVVRWYSTTISSEDFKSIRRVAGDILGRASISVSWCDCGLDGAEPDHPPADCAQPPHGAEVIMRIVPIGPEEPADGRSVLGSSLVDPRARRGTISTVYADRVMALAHSANVDAADILARAVVHELGHLLLGTIQHARHGVMREKWSIDELRTNSPLDWVFSNDEARTMKDALMARAARDSEPRCLCH
jgi:hypothetical protein